MITAMTELIIFLVVVLLVGAALASLADVLHDGYGHTDPPRRLSDTDPLSFHSSR
jgi:archaellum component FlaG (FlaF/FlaG flagellin family)